MKPLHFLSIFCFTTLMAHAGNFFGPGPYRNGSPLVTGVDGTYQATATDWNVTGIFRFAYSGGTQTSNSRQNSWIFFREGQVMKGSVEAAIDGSNLTGILGSLNDISANNTNAISFPHTIQSSSSDSIGSFNGKLNAKSPTGNFSGSGVFRSLDPATNYYAIITIGTGVNAGDINFSNVAVPVGNAGNGFTNYFKFRGVRTSITSSTNTN